MRHLGWRKILVCAAAVAAALGGFAAVPQAAQAVSSGAVRPCDIYATRGTPCVAAYSTVRALYRDYHGALYQVTRASDGATHNIGVLKLSGYANVNAQNTFCAGNAQSGALTTDYNGPLPDLGGYTPMQQEGAITLGTGGDNSNQSTGYFFEGVITAGYPSAATDNAIQANIVAANYQQA